MVAPRASGEPGAASLLGARCRGAGADLSQALVAAPVAARGQPGRDLAELAAHLLGGERGLAQAALDKTPVPATASARLLGGARSAALVIDVRAPASALDDAVTEVKALLAKLQALRDMMGLRDYVEEGPVGKRRLPVLANDVDDDEDEIEVEAAADDDADEVEAAPVIVPPVFEEIAEFDGAE